MNHVADGSGLLGALAVVLAGLGAWWAARPVVLSSVQRRSGDANARVSGKRALNVLERVDTLVMDPVGTITMGELSVVSVEPIDPAHDRSLRWFAGALQHTSDDPVARAIARLASRGRVTDVEHVPGIGSTGSVDRHPVRVGRPDWIGVEGLDDGWSRVVAVEVDGKAMGRITVADTVRDQAAPTTAALTEAGWRVVLVAPDEAGSKHLASAVGTAEVVAATDGGGGAVVRRLKADGRVVAVVGRSGTLLVPLSEGDVAVSDAKTEVEARVEMTDVAVHHVAAVLKILRGAARRVRSMRRAVAVLGLAGLVGLALSPAPWTDAAAAAGTVLLLPLALTIPLLRWD